MGEISDEFINIPMPLFYRFLSGLLILRIVLGASLFFAKPGPIRIYFRLLGGVMSASLLYLLVISLEKFHYPSVLVWIDFVLEKAILLIVVYKINRPVEPVLFA
jgi:hypothetical protein